MSDQQGTLGSGTVLEGRYELLEEIARGGFGMVFRARQLQMDREVAVKTLPPEFVASDEMIERFRREAQFASQLNHPNTVTVHDYGKHEDYLYLVMELLEGEDLADVLARDRTVPLDRILPIARQVLKSLREAHELNIVHRDLKPENIFLSEIGQKDEVVKVLDFGIAKLAMSDAGTETEDDGSRRRLTAEGTTMGTPIYMSPEQAAGDGIDHRTDLYALGVILYEMACGVPPFDHEESAIVMRRHIHADIPEFPDEELRGTWLDDVIKIALRKNREDRFQNASDLLEAIDEAVARERVPAEHRRKEGESVLDRYESGGHESASPTEIPSTGSRDGEISEIESRDEQSAVSNSSSIVTVIDEPGSPDDVVVLDNPKDASDAEATASPSPSPERNEPPAEDVALQTTPSARPAEDASSAADDTSSDASSSSSDAPSPASESGKPPPVEASEPSIESPERERSSSSWSWAVEDDAPPSQDPVPDVDSGGRWRRVLLTLLVVGLIAGLAFFVVM